MDRCQDVRAALDSWIDGAAEAPPHVESCRECLREAEARRALRARLRRLRLPAVPGLDARVRLVLRRDSVLARWLPMTTPYAAAAALVAALFLFRPSSSEPLPDLVARAAEFHDGVCDGRIKAEELNDPEAVRRYFREQLRLDVEVPKPDASLSGCCCAPGNDTRMPCIVYRVRGMPMSLLVFEGPLPPMPPSARRLHGGQEYFVFRRGRCTVLVCRSGPVCHLWVAALPEKELLEAALATSVGRRAFSGERLTLSGVT